ncbi:MAG: dihydroneopterin aldolase [Flavobacteriales bacterium]|nr:dihydroneopterin aldolase [Flavobacteriales bacterium]|tara:strand:+ start:819 stop:1178 length:360 start_codon:yes stop_codon:yes gene_type:complete
MGVITVSGIKLYAFHGCMQEEAKIGSDYEVDVVLECDFSEAAMSDDLTQTVNYVAVNKIVTEEMAIRSKLLEHVAQRIITKLADNHPEIVSMEVSVAKLNPPIDGNVDRVVVTEFLKSP